MEIKFNWSIKVGESDFTGNAKAETFEEVETFIKNLKATVDIIKPQAEVNKDN